MITMGTQARNLMPDTSAAIAGCARPVSAVPPGCARPRYLAVLTWPHPDRARRLGQPDHGLRTQSLTEITGSCDASAFGDRLSKRKLDSPRREVGGHQARRGEVDMAVLVEASDVQAGRDLATDLFGQGVAELEQAPAGQALVPPWRRGRCSASLYGSA